jgi:dTDP-4-dehydrorhamnose 3,5-epimerase
MIIPCPLLVYTVAKMANEMVNVVQTLIKEVIVLQPKQFEDIRGFFFEAFNTSRWRSYGIDGPFVQDNQSGSCRGVLRGLHYQIQQPQGKLVRAVVGEIFDVAVDIRRNSSTFGQWVGEHISAKNKKQLWIPPGFAHGFYVLSEWAEVIYKATDYYAPQAERTIIWNDPQIGIKWPILENLPLIISDKDRRGKSLPEADVFA